MTATFSKSRVPDITPQQWERLRPQLQEQGFVLEVPQLRSSTGMGFDDAEDVIAELGNDGLATLHTLVFHSCCEHCVAEEDWPWLHAAEVFVCPECGQDDVAYEFHTDIRGILKAPVELID